MEESVHGSAQREEHAGGSAVQLGEVHLHCGLFAGMAGRCRGSPEPARKHKTGMRLDLNTVSAFDFFLIFFFFCEQIRSLLIHPFI